MKLPQDYGNLRAIQQQPVEVASTVAKSVDEPVEQSCSHCEQLNVPDSSAIRECKELSLVSPSRLVQLGV